MSILLATASLAQGNTQVKALLVGDPGLTVEFENYLEHYGAKVDSESRLNEDSLLRLDSRDILVLCAPMSSTPIQLSSNEMASILRFVERGGRAYVEYADFPDGTLPGWKIDRKPILNRFEMLAAEVDNPAGSSLAKDDLLEEHNSYLLNFQPPSDARMLLNYGLYLGTYKIAWQLKEDLPSYTVTVDLGSEKEIAGAAQWFGGKNPNYAPDLVRFSTAGEDKKFGSVTEVVYNQFIDGHLKASANLGRVRARYVRVWCQKAKTSPVTDFIKLDGVEVYDAGGRNIAKGCDYRFQTKSSQPDIVHEGALTLGRPPQSFEQDRTYLYGVPAHMGWNTRKWNALAEWRYGKGVLYYSATSLSIFRKHNYRLTARWEDLIRGLSLSLFPENAQPTAAVKWVPLKAYTQPRRWVEPGTPVELRVETAPGATVSASAEGLRLGLSKEVSPGVFIIQFRPDAGEYEISVTSSKSPGSNTAKTKLSVCTRKNMYRRALDRNMQWFMKSGVVNGDDAGGGVKSTIEIGALYAGIAEELPSPYRVDCQSMTGKAFYLYGDLTGEQKWKTRAENLAKLVIAHQFTDPSLARFGGFRWLFEGSDGIYPQDDNNRNADFLAFLWQQTGKQEYLEAALRNIEMLRDTCREDGTLGYFFVSPVFLDTKGRFAMRNVDENPCTPYSFQRFHTGWTSTARNEYLDALKQLIHIYGLAYITPQAIDRMAFGWNTSCDERVYGYAVKYLQKDDPLRDRILNHIIADKQKYLDDPAVKKYGSPIQSGDIDPESLERAFSNDSAVHTFAGEPITDQLYATSWTSYYAWYLYKSASKENTLRKYFESTLDYLVRIQFENPDPRLDGCWMRGFDMENWEYYGTRYDPNYGAYHAYTGWMNSTIATALAWYLLDSDPYAAVGPDRQAEVEAVLSRVRAEVKPSFPREVNYLRGVVLSSNHAPDLGSRSISTITDGIIEGIHEDNLSAGWTVPAGTDDFVLELTADLGRPVDVSRLSVRTGGFDPMCLADAAELYLGSTPDELKPALTEKLASHEGMNWFSFNEQQSRYVRIRLTKHKDPTSSQRLYLGEIQLIGLSE